MIKPHRLLLALFLTLQWNIVLAQSRPLDEFSKCMDRTKADRMTCESGCGMIIQGCYEEGVLGLAKQEKFAQDEIAAKIGQKCYDLAKSYSEKALRMERSFVEQWEGMFGWLPAELQLNFARQRLSNVRLIQKKCRE
ncbi:hypothetical protein [Cupriavidus campinensis]